MYIALGVVYLIAALAIAAVIAFTTVRSIKHNGALLTKKNMLYLAPTFLIIYLLHITAAAYSGVKINFFYCFSLVDVTLNALKFKAAEALLMPICNAYPLYYVDFVLAFIIGGITVIMSVVSFFCVRINNSWAVSRLLRKNCDIVIGDSPSALKYVNNSKNTLLLCGDMPGKRYVDLLKQGTRILRLPLDRALLAKILKRGGYNIIVFRDAKYSYSEIIEKFTDLTNGGEIKIYLEANLQEMKILKEKFVTKADKIENTYIAGFNKYELTARNFVFEHPITKYIPRSFYNDNYTVKNDKKIHVVFIGFGNFNYQMFRLCAMQYQFAGEKNGKLVSHPVEYHVFDNDDQQLHNEFFSKMLYEFDDEFSDCDFQKPEKICELKDIERLDINSVEAKKKFKSFVSKDSFTYFIISLESDLEDASYAQTVKRLMDDDDNYRIFVRAKNDNGEKLNDISDKIIYFGEEKKLYTHENIVNDTLTELAQKINLFYNKISNPPEWLAKLKENNTMTEEERNRALDSNLALSKNREYMQSVWRELPNIEQESNLYHALNLPFKLNLMGYDMVKKRDGNDTGITEAEFDTRYINSGRESDYADYSFFFKTESSNVLAFIEHLRWNALYILYDYKQMKKADIRVVNGTDADGNATVSMPHKDLSSKRHACITTYYGINELIEYKYAALYPNEQLSEKSYKNNARLQELSKIYAYDYMDLDRLYGEITAMGYKLVENE